YSTSIAKAMGLSLEDIENIRQASILHDLGKVGVSDKILHKKTKLTKREFDEIKRHPQIAADIIRPVHFLHDIIPLILYHHERWDGKGYPSGLMGPEIPIGARIISVADVYQALTSKRPYRKAFSESEAIRMIKEGYGTQFDPEVVNVFMKVIGKEKRDNKKDKKKKTKKGKR
ncbi:MAG: HD-GYP domain-containing protein, partial [Candidatus Omnitrophota bacterium]